MTTAVKERPILFSGPMVRAILDGRKTQTRRIVKPQPAAAPSVNKAQYWVGCPYGGVGTRLWVRETWRSISSGTREGGFDYRANDPSASGVGFTAWKPSIHMPRVASRITLEITAVRVERLKDISAEDAKAEGISNVFDAVFLGKARSVEAACYATLWESINGEGSWAVNPWVWVVEFKKVE